MKVPPHLLYAQQRKEKIVNKKQRKTLDGLIEQLGDLAGKLDDLKNEIEAIKDEEQEKLDNMPDSLRDGDKGDTLSSIIEMLQTAEDKAGEANEAADEAKSSLEEAVAA